MSISETERHEIHEPIKAATSDRVANNVMSMLPPVGWADVATKTDLESLRSETASEFGSVRAEIGALLGRSLPVPDGVPAPTATDDVEVCC